MNLSPTQVRNIKAHAKHAEFTLGTGGVTLNRCDSNDTTVYVKSPLDQIQRLYFIFW